jgi:hypothetical protein
MASRAQPISFSPSRKSSFAKIMSTNIAYALVVYTLLLIFEVSPQMENKGMSIWPYFFLALLVGLAIIPCRNLERRWQQLDQSNDSNLSKRFWVEAIMLWLFAIALPTGLMALIYIIP